MKDINGKPLAFMSYAHIDDEISLKKLKKVRDRIKNELIELSGFKDFEIYFDKDNLETSQLWEKRINQALDDATFLIPIITPSFFNSAECRNELRRFLARKEISRYEEIIFPIYFIEVQNYSKESLDELVREMAIRQYADFRKFRLGNLNTIEAGEAISNFAKLILKKSRIKKDKVGNIFKIKSDDLNRCGAINAIASPNPKRDFEDEILLLLRSPEEFYYECKKVHENNTEVCVLSKTPVLIMFSERDSDLKRDYFDTICSRLSEGKEKYNLKYLFDIKEFVHYIKTIKIDEIEEIRTCIMYFSKFDNLHLRFCCTKTFTGSVIGADGCFVNKNRLNESLITCIGLKDGHKKAISRGIRIRVPELVGIIVNQYDLLYKKSKPLDVKFIDKIAKRIQIIKEREMKSKEREVPF